MINVPTTFSDIRTWVRTAANALNRVQADPTVLQFRPSPEPLDPVEGSLYVDNVTGKLRYREAGAWVDLN